MFAHSTIKTGLVLGLIVLALHALLGDGVTPSSVHAAVGSLPGGFVEQEIASKLNSPTQIVMAPDGRVFVTQQGGAIRVIKNDHLLPTPFYTVTTASVDEEGLTGLAFDPDFASNGYVYVTYTVPAPRPYQRLSRLTAAGDVAAPGSEATLFEMTPNELEYHLAGALDFGSDGKLYLATGDGLGGGAQSFTSFAGKILRLNKDGSIPADNPFAGTAQGLYRSIWAYGFRNPFTLSLDRAASPAPGRMYVGDVGAETWEEVNDVRAGGNYGWPLSEGPSVGPGQIAPIYAYDHSQGCAITAGAFYLGSQFPVPYRGKYFFADYCEGWIRYLDPALPSQAQPFGVAAGVGLVGMAQSAGGSLYYLARGSTGADGGSGAGFDTGSVYKITYTGSEAPSIVSQPADQTVSEGQTARFRVTASGAEPLSYQWQRNDADIPGATSASYTTPPTALSDNGARYRVVVTNRLGSATSDEATLTVSQNRAPVVSITAPISGTRYVAGETIPFSGTATDPDSGPLPASAFTWKVDLHHDQHTHPFLPTTTGVTSGTVQIPTVGHPNADVFLRFFLSVSDGQLTSTTYTDIYPTVSTLTLTTDPPGLEVRLDGQPHPAPYSEDGLVGVLRQVGVVSPQTLNGTLYEFTGWSDGGGAEHTVAMPPTHTTLTASFRAVASDTIVDWGGDYVSEDTALRRYVTIDQPLDLGGGSGNDARGYLALSDTEPLNPRPEGGNAYGGTYTLGTSARFYGGILMHHYGGPFGNIWGEVWQQGDADHIYYSADETSDGWALFYWQHEDFLNGASEGRVVFNADSRLDILNFSGANGSVPNNSGRVRFVVRDGGQFYISQDYADNSVTSFSLTNLPSRSWAPYAPTPPYNLKFRADQATFAPHTFTDITAVGLYHSNDNSTASNRRAGLNFERFRVRAAVLEPSRDAFQLFLPYLLRARSNAVRQGGLACRPPLASRAFP